MESLYKDTPEISLIRTLQAAQGRLLHYTVMKGLDTLLYVYMYLEVILKNRESVIDTAQEGSIMLT